MVKHKRNYYMQKALSIRSNCYFLKRKFYKRKERIKGQRNAKNNVLTAPHK